LYDLRAALSLLRQGKPCGARSPAHSLGDNDGAVAVFGPQGRRKLSPTGTALTLVASGLPLGVVVGLNSLSQNIPRYWLEANWGERELGIFSAMAIFMRVGFYLETALVQPALPRLSRFFAQGEHQRAVALLGRLVALASMVGLGQVVVAVAFGPQLLSIVYAPQYSTYGGVFIGLMVAAAIGYVAGVLKAAADAARTFLVQLPLFAGAVIISAAVGWTLIPSYGLLGAALTVVFAKSTLLLGYALILGQALRSAVSVKSASTSLHLTPTRELSR
jgi:O-antigen/teichoic acid export membrane protein